MQSEDWRARADRAITLFPAVVRAHVSAEALELGYFTTHGREGDKVRPFPRLVIGIVPALPGVFESRHEALACAKRAAREAMKQSGSAIHVDEQIGNAYPRSMLL
jgi:hypothetical protein